MEALDPNSKPLEPGILKLGPRVAKLLKKREMLFVFESHNPFLRYIDYSL